MYIYNSNSVIITPTCKFGLYSWTKAQLEPFGINKFSANASYTDFIAILVDIIYNVLLTCHLYIYNSNSVYKCTTAIPIGWEWQ